MMMFGGNNPYRLFFWGLFLFWGCIFSSLASDSLNYRELVLEYEKKFKAHPSLKEALDLSLLYEEEGRIKEAIRLLEEVYSAQKDDRVLFHLARLYSLDARPQRAIKLFRVYLRKNPQDKNAYFYLGLAYEDSRNQKKAIECYRKILKIDSYDILALIRLAEIYLESSDYKKVVEYLGKAINYEPALTSFYKILGKALLEREEYLRSFKIFQKAVDIYPNDEEVKEGYKLAKVGLGKDFFEKEKKKKELRRRKLSLRVKAFPEEEKSLEVSVGLLEGGSTCKFKSTGAFYVYSKGRLVFEGLPQKIYVIELTSFLKASLKDKESFILKGLEPPILLENKDNQNLFAIFGLSHGKGQYWSKQWDGFFRGKIKILITNRGLTLINILDIEEYLYGVLPSEVPFSWPEEALAAQAVVARTIALKELNRHKNKGFNFCATVHCQVYQGASQERPRTSRAVDKTRGLVLSYADKPIEALYSSNCGGYFQFVPPEDEREAGKEEGALDGDGDGFPFPLSPSELYRWLIEEPQVFCKLEGEEKSRFRWVRFYRREELEEILKEKGWRGKIKFILPEGRRLSGHITSLRIIKEKGEEYLNSEFQIRKYLDNLRSSLFRVEVKYNFLGEPQYFIFRGGGFGHGRGMCQWGAKGMAEKGYNFREILKHYFPQAQLKTLKEISSK